MKKQRETSKTLLWTVIALSAFFSLLSLALCAIWARDQLGIAATVVGGLWGGAVTAVIACYSDKAKAENVLKISQQESMEAMQEAMSEIAQTLADVRQELAALKRQNTNMAKKLNNP